ncbi:hypothetical protein HQ619_06160 [Burkholderia gladioli]|uniref:hypothetical protein n=1 Tax=Burkholderia gladioli TaxID=28095 RepID=UPI00155FFF4A|nr:hypothetical protein [Burkholderia gladioli]NRF83510.1 hypothetical protein [Burkholderia gladioli]
MKNICVNRNSKNFVWSFVTGLLLRCGAMGGAIGRQGGLEREMGEGTGSRHRERQARD